MTQTVRIPLVSKDVEDLLLWRSVPKSGAALAAIAAAYFVLEWSGLSVLAIAANGALLTVAVAFVWNNVAGFIGKPGFPVPAFLKSGVTDTQVRSFADAAAVYVNKALAFAYRLVSGKDILLAGQAALALFAIGKVAAWFTSLGLVFVSAALAFSVPKIYELRKGEIDGLAAKAADQGKAHYKKFLEPYVAKIPRASTAVGGGGGGGAAAAAAAPAKKAE